MNAAYDTPPDSPGPAGGPGNAAALLPSPHPPSRAGNLLQASTGAFSALLHSPNYAASAAGAAAGAASLGSGGAAGGSRPPLPSPPAPSPAGDGRANSVTGAARGSPAGPSAARPFTSLAAARPPGTDAAPGPRHSRASAASRSSAEVGAAGELRGCCARVSFSDGVLHRAVLQCGGSSGGRGRARRAHTPVRVLFVSCRAEHDGEDEAGAGYGGGRHGGVVTALQRDAEERVRRERQALEQQVAESLLTSSPLFQRF